MPWQLGSIVHVRRVVFVAIPDIRLIPFTHQLTHAEITKKRLHVHIIHDRSVGVHDVHVQCNM